MSWSIEDHRVIVTGGTTGIGRATAEALSSRGGLVTITSRDSDRGGAAAEEISGMSGHPVDSLPLDLADLGSIRTFMDAFRARSDSLSILINNAGVAVGRRTETTDGFERTLATNHLGPFELTRGLMDLLIASAPSRVINVASSAHGWAKDDRIFDDPNLEHDYGLRRAYGQSKLANILHARALAERYGPSGISAYAVHPGVVRTHLGRGGDALLVSIGSWLGGWRMLSPAEGADTIVWLATESDPPQPNGGYFEQRQPARSSKWARDPDAPDRLWELTTRMLAGAGEGTAT